MNIRFKTFLLCLLVSIPPLALAQTEVNLTTTKGDAAEAGQEIGTIQVSRTGSTAADLRVFMQYSGSAVYGTDFLTSGMTGHGADLWSILIPVGAFEASGTFTPLRDNLIEGTEQISYTLQTDPAYTIGTDIQADVNIADDVATVTLTLVDGEAAEAGQDTGTITVSRTDNGDTSQAFTVYMQGSGSAVYGTDFLTSGMSGHGADRWSITIPGGAFEASGSITPLKDNLIEGTETMTYQLEEEATRFFVASLDPLNINITDDVATVKLTLVDGEAAEAGQDTGTITVSRTDNGDTSQAFTVYMQGSGSAVYGTDFLTSGMSGHGADRWSITIPGGAFEASGSITPLKDNLIEGTETTTYQLEEEATRFFVASLDPVNINITDDVATVTLTLVDGEAAEAGQDTGTITVSRTDNGNTSQAFTVYMQGSGSAVYGTDFLTSGMSGHGADRWSITIPGGAFEASGSITPLKDNLIEGTETTTYQLEEEATRFFVASLDPVNINITDDVATVTLTLVDGEADEQYEDPGTITVMRTDNGDTSQAFSIFMQKSGTAVYGTDFLTSGMSAHGADRWSISIPAGAFEASGTIIPRFEEILEGDETVIFTLHDEDTLYFIGSPDEATITIKDFVKIIFKDSFEDP